MRTRHGRYFADLADAADAPLRVEQHNLRTAADHALARGDGDIARRAGLGALGVMERSAPLGELAAFAEALLAAPGLDPGTQVGLRARAATALDEVGRFDDAAAHVDAAVAAAGTDSKLRAPALRARARHRRALGDLDGSLADAQASVAQARAARSSTTEGLALQSLGLTWSARGDLDGARRSYERVLALGGRVGPGTHVNALANLALVERKTNHPKRSRDLYEQALVRYRRSGDRRSTIGALFGLGSLALERGDPRDARRHYEASRPLVVALGDDFQVAALEGNLGLACRAEGDLVMARAHAQSALEHINRVGRPRLFAIALGNLVELDLLTGDLDRAESELREACESLRELGERQALAELLPCWVRVALAQGDLVAATERAEEAVPEARRTGSHRVLADALACRAELELAEGRTPDLTELEAVVARVDPDAPIHQTVAALRLGARDSDPQDGS